MGAPKPYLQMHMQIMQTLTFSLFTPCSVRSQKRAWEVTFEGDRSVSARMGSQLTMTRVLHCILEG